MSLIDKEVKIRLNSNTFEYYKKLGYKIPMKKASKSYYERNKIEYVIDRSKKIKVKIEDLSFGSGVIVRLKCDNCGEITKSRYNDYLSHNHNGKTYCNKCNSKVLCGGEKAYNYRHDLTDEERKYSRQRNLNPKYKEMIKTVLVRDNYTCICCHNRIDEKGVVHHLEGYSSNKELQCEQSNCVTLCFNCHERYHRIYGKLNVSKKDFEEFLGRAVKELKEYNGVLPSAKQVYCIEENKIYESCEQIHNEWGCDMRSVYNMCNHNPKRIVKSVKGKHLLWYDEYKNMTKHEVDKYLKNCEHETCSKEIICMETKKCFKSANKVYECYNIKPSVLRSSCRGKYKFTGGYHWMYYEDYIKLTEEQIINILEHKYTRYDRKDLKKVICLTTNNVFESIIETKDFYNVNSSGIIRCCKGKQKTCGKLPDGTPLRWQYYSDYIKEQEK